jgi:hypothetical protein
MVFSQWPPAVQAAASGNELQSRIICQLGGELCFELDCWQFEECHRLRQLRRNLRLQLGLRL